jgi:hypothetical protein
MPNIEVQAEAELPPTLVLKEIDAKKAVKESPVKLEAKQKNPAQLNHMSKQHVHE